MTVVSLAGITLENPDGEIVPIERLFEYGDVRPRWLVIQALRYYG